MPAEPLSEEIVWLAPTENVPPVRLIWAVVPSAAAEFEFSEPPWMFTTVPVTRLEASLASVTDPAPVGLMVMVRACPPSLSGPRFSEPLPPPMLSATSNVALPLRFVLENVSAYAALVASALVTESLLPPMLRLPMTAASEPLMSMVESPVTVTSLL